MSAYDLDLHAWAHAQADALRRRSANEVDWENVAEEIESLGKQQFAELRNRLRVLLIHLLKWTYQPDRRGRSWSNTIRIQRRDTLRHLRENPSLKSIQAEALADAYDGARFEASSETEMDVDVFPQTSPFTFDQTMDEDFWPEAVTVEQSPH